MVPDASIIIPNGGIPSPRVHLIPGGAQPTPWSHKYLCWIEPSLSQPHGPAGHTGSGEIHPWPLPQIYPCPGSRCRSPLSLCRHLQRREKNEVCAPAWPKNMPELACSQRNLCCASLRATWLSTAKHGQRPRQINNC